MDDCTSLLGQSVDVYCNLTRKCLSVRKRGVVIAHVDAITLRDVQFVVQPAGRERARRTGQRNVHAFARGTVTEAAELAGVRVRYNPYKVDTFIKAESGEAIYQAPACHLSGKTATI